MGKFMRRDRSRSSESHWWSKRDQAEDVCSGVTQAYLRSSPISEEQYVKWLQQVRNAEAHQYSRVIANVRLKKMSVSASYSYSTTSKPAASDKSTGATKIYRPPCAFLSGALSVMFGKKIFERVFEQMIEDTRCEYFAAIKAESPKLARWVHYRGAALLVVAALSQAPVSLAKLIVSIWKAAN